MACVAEALAYWDRYQTNPRLSYSKHFAASTFTSIL